MNNTALRTSAESTNSHMVFESEEHEVFCEKRVMRRSCLHEAAYYERKHGADRRREKLAKARYQDCYHAALIYVLGRLAALVDAAFAKCPFVLARRSLGSLYAYREIQGDISMRFMI